MSRTWLAAAACVIGLATACASSAPATSSPPQSSPEVSPEPGVLVTPPTPVVLPGTLLVSAPSGEVVWALLNGMYLYRSRDRGSTWEQRPLPPVNVSNELTEISFIDYNVGWLLATGVPETQCNGEGAAVWGTQDGGQTWEDVSAVDHDHQVPAGIGYAQCKESLSFVDAMHGFIGAGDENRQPTVYRTADGGRTWAASNLPDPPGFTSTAGGFTLRAGLVRRFGGTLLVSAQGLQASAEHEFVFRSDDGGATWVYAAAVQDVQLTVTFVTASHWLELIYPGQSMETTNAGASWHASASNYGQAAPIAPTIVFGDPAVGYATVRGELKRSVDGGLTWSDIKTPGAYEPWIIQGA
ncbi:MAG: WD40/YVTN/BNR-like repeat-containing protein [Candidatus Dormibacterales bacterium]